MAAASQVRSDLLLRTIYDPHFGNEPRGAKGVIVTVRDFSQEGQRKVKSGKA